eukprot:scaffold1589_cov111-Isochrysis_galbana.AAC.1
MELAVTGATKAAQAAKGADVAPLDASVMSVWLVVGGLRLRVCVLLLRVSGLCFCGACVEGAERLTLVQAGTGYWIVFRGCDRLFRSWLFIEPNTAAAANCRQQLKSKSPGRQKQRPLPNVRPGIQQPTIGYLHIHFSYLGPPLRLQRPLACLRRSQPCPVQVVGLILGPQYATESTMSSSGHPTSIKSTVPAFPAEGA